MRKILPAMVMLLLASSLGLAQATTRPTSRPAGTQPAKVEPGKAFRETWNWVRYMQPVAKKFKGAEGVVIFIGDSFTYSAPATAWARYFAADPDKGGYSESDKAILKWSHVDEPEKDTNGWWLAYVDRPTNRSETAAGGLDTAELLKGNFQGLPSLAEMIKKYNPQVAFVQLSANDVRYNKPDESAKQMGQIIDALLANGTVPVLMTLPPMKQDNLEQLKTLNEKYRVLASEKQVPMIDVFAEVMALQPGDNWRGTLAGDDGFPTANTLNGPPTEENLKNSGYLLRCWLTVQKLKEIKEKVLDKK